MILSTRIPGERFRKARRTRSLQPIGVLLLARLLAAPLVTHAQTDYWNGNNDYWDVGADWSLGQPTSLYAVENDTSGTITYRSGTNIVNSFLNTSSGGFNLTGGTLTTNTFFTNSGTGTIAISDGTLNVGYFLNTNLGVLSVSGGVFNVSGSFNNSGGGVLTFSGGLTTVTGNFSSAGATTVTGGTLSGSGATTSNIEVDNTFVLQNATLTNFSVTNSSTLQIQNGTLTNVVLDGGLTLTNGSTANFGDSVTFGSVTPTTIDNGSTLAFNGTNNPTFNTELIFGSNGGNLTFNNLTLTLGSSALVHGGATSRANSGTIGSGNNDTLINQGTIDADVNGGTITINSAKLTNTGTLEAENGGSLSINATNWAIGGTLLTVSGGTIYLGGTLNNTGTTYDALNSIGGTHNAILVGTLNGGNLANSGALQIEYGTLSNINLDGGLTVNNSYPTYIGDGVTFGTATSTTIDNGSTLLFDGTHNPTFNTELIFGSNGGNCYFDNVTLTLGSSALVHGDNGTLGDGNNDTLINQGTIDADVNGGTITINSAKLTNTGTLEAENGGSLSINATNWAIGGTLLTVSGGTIYLGGTLNNTGATLDALNIVGGTHNAILSGTLNGGNLVNSSALQIQGGTLTNIVMDGGLTLTNGATAIIGNGVTFGSATPTIVDGNLSSLIFAATNWTLPTMISTSNGGTIYLAGTHNNAGATFDALNIVGGTNNVILSGTLSGGNVINSSALQFEFGTLTNVTLDGGLTITNGSVANISDGVTFGAATPTTLDNGSTLAFNGTTNPTLNTELIFGSNGGNIYFDNLTLTLGTNALVHGANGTIGSGNNDTLINQGTINADVSGGILSINSANFTNTGTLEAQNGSIAINSNLVLAGGDLYVGTGNTVSATGSVTQTGGTTRVDGTLNTASNLQLQGGAINGTGTINGNINNTGGTLRPGDLLGTLTINGTYTQTVGGKTEIDLGGTQQGVTYDLLTVTSLATLGGELDIKLVNGFTPTVGETFDFLSYGSRTGAYDTLLSLDNGYNYSVNYDATTGLGILTVETIIASVPESSTLLTASLILGTGGLLLRRRACRQSAQLIAV